MPEPATDAWFESERPTRIGMVEELQRIRRRFRARPLPVLALAALLTGAITYKLATRKLPVEAEVVLALTEGSLSAKHNGLRVDELREYVASVWMPNAKLGKLIEQHRLARIRAGFGLDAAVAELRENIEVQVWKNTFAYYDEDAERAEHSARIGISYRDVDPDRAFDVAHDMAQIVIDTFYEQRQALADDLAKHLDARVNGLQKQLDKLAGERAAKQLALSNAQPGADQVLRLELAEIDGEEKKAEAELSTIATSQDVMSDEIAKSGLELSLEIVDEHHPEPQATHAFLIVMIVVIVGVGSLLGSALLVGAFDSRIHDIDDVERLGVPILGHVPGFPGDAHGSLRGRGASRARVPSFQRWRSHR